MSRITGKLLKCVIVCLTLSCTARAADQLVTSNADSGAGSLRQACLDAGDGDTILFNTGATTILLTSGELTMASAVTILATNITIDAGGTNRVFNITPGGNDHVVLNGLTMANGFTTNNGGGIRFGPATGASITLTNCVVTGCHADVEGGGLRPGSAVNLGNTDFIGNDALNGGAIYMPNADVSLTIYGGSFVSNLAANGGAIRTGFWQGNTMNSYGATLFSNNTATAHGGAVYSYRHGGYFNGATFVDNSAGGDGGAIHFSEPYRYDKELGLNGCTFLRNESGTNSQDIGGAINITGNGPVHVLNSHFEANICRGSQNWQGGGAIATRGKLVVSNCSFRVNRDLTPTGYGGAIGAQSGGLTVYNSLFEGNTSTGPGGGIYCTTRMQLESCTFITNQCATDGGGVYYSVDLPTTNFNCTFFGNIAGDGSGDDGGAFFQNNGTSYVYSCTVYSNYGGVAGIRSSGNFFLYSSIVAGNISTVDGSTNDLGGTFQVVDHCLIQEDVSGYTALGGTNNINGVDPILLPYADNGGPSLLSGALYTHALPVNSPAVNAGSNPLALPWDQRGEGFVREGPPGSPDIGAFERQRPSPYTVISVY